MCPPTEKPTEQVGPFFDFYKLLLSSQETESGAEVGTITS